MADRSDGVEGPADEIERLRRCINDLIGVLALPALWSGGEPLQIMGILLSGMVGMLHLEFAFARLNNVVQGSRVEMVRAAASQPTTAESTRVSRVLDDWLARGPSASPSTIPNPVGAGEVRVASFALGLQDDLGVVVAGSRRLDFPTTIERLLLSVAANQAAIWLHEARRVGEQRRVSEELERMVAERTAQLIQANEALRAEIAEHERADAMLEASERRFRLLAEAIPHHVWTHHPDGTPAYSNRQLVDYTGLEGDEMGRGGSSAIHPDDVERVEVAWREAVSAGTLFEVELRMRGRDGRYHRFLSRAVPAYNRRSQFAEWFGTNTDIEERKQSEESLQQVQTELTHASRVTTVGGLAASIAHEVNQPLGAIVTNGEACLHLISRDEPSLDAVREAVECMIGDALRSGEVIARIRALVKRATPETAPLDVNETIREVIALAAGELARNEVTLRTALGPELRPVAGDRVQLQQVLLNLVLNASAAMGEPGGQQRDVLISSYESGASGIVVAVRDSGQGFDPSDANRLFDAFYTTKEGGLGLGLSISRTIVEAHGGSLSAESTPGEGATFRFTLPIIGIAYP